MTSFLLGWDTGPVPAFTTHTPSYLSESERCPGNIGFQSQQRWTSEAFQCALRWAWTDSPKSRVTPVIYQGAHPSLSATLVSVSLGIENICGSTLKLNKLCTNPELCTLKKKIL